MQSSSSSASPAASERLPRLQNLHGLGRNSETSLLQARPASCTFGTQGDNDNENVRHNGLFRPRNSTFTQQPPQPRGRMLFPDYESFSDLWVFQIIQIYFRNSAYAFWLMQTKIAFQFFRIRELLKLRLSHNSLPNQEVGCFLQILNLSWIFVFRFQ